jgi:hypothetical protein
MTFISSCKKLNYGVPQGSVLGPLQFLLFINDLPKALQDAKIILFADDTNIFLIEKNQTAMIQIENCFTENQLITNTEKTNAQFFQGRSPRLILKPDLFSNSKEITHTSNVKFLGIYITNDFSWASHILYLTQILNKSIYLIKSLRDLVSLPI